MEVGTILETATSTVKIAELLADFLKLVDKSGQITNVLLEILQAFISLVQHLDLVGLASKVIKVALAVLAYLNVSVTGDWPRHSDVTDGQHFDFIIVGGGTAGCVLANRLTEEPGSNVLLIEAGGDPPIFSVIPGMWPFFSHLQWDWDYYAEDDGYSSQSLNFRKVAHTRGKMLGGSSSLDHLVYERGTKADYDDWANITGDEGWGWNSVLKYFKKSENMLDESILNSPTASFHSNKGSLSVKNHTVNSLFLGKNKIMLEAFHEILGAGTLKDPYTSNIIGNYEWHYKIKKNSRRASTADEYLIPIKDRSNFFLMKHTLVTKIIFNDKKEATGVKVRTKYGDIRIYANKEIIISAGAFNSPQLLMLSGIGPRKHLNKFDISLIADLPVGQNLLDQIKIPIVISGQKKIVTALDSIISLTELNSMPLPVIGGAFSLEKKHQTIQHLTAFYGALSPLLLYVMFVALNWNVQVTLSYLLTEPAREKMQILVFIPNLKSTGTVSLRSSNIEHPPIIKTGYFKDREDLEIVASALKRIYKLKDSKYFKEAGGRFIRPPLPRCDHLKYLSDEYFSCLGRELTTTAYQPGGTCAMGKVVNSDLKVKNVSRLRVVDSSVIPSMPKSKLGAVTVMLAERGADLIKQDHS